MRADELTAGAAGVQFDIMEVGSVRSVREFIVEATGLPSCINGQMVSFKHGLKGMVMGFSGDEVQILVFGSKADIHAGDEVYSRGEPLRLPAGEAFQGRMVNALSEPQDGLGPIQGDTLSPVFKEARGVMERRPVDQTLETGCKIIDEMIPIAKGQRQLIIGDRLTGKTTIGIDTILNQKGKGVICIYCCIGKTYSSLLKVLTLLREQEAVSYTIVVSAIASTSPGEQFLSPYTASMLGEYFMERGKDVFVVFDDLTKHAWIYRQISLLLERPPGREAYPGDIFYIHSQMMERAGYLKTEIGGGGSMTFFPIVEILQGDVTGYVSSNLISMTDGQIYLSTALFNKGFKPAIDLGLSVSRIGSKAQWPALREMSSRLRLEFLQYQEVLRMTQLRATGLSKEAEERLRRGQVISHLILQDKNEPVSMEEQIMHLYALSRGVLDNLSESDIHAFKRNFYKSASESAPAVAVRLREGKVLSDDMKKDLDQALAGYFQ
ncbi:MAG: F0F1 ATP synthase subunit alpha [Candidatus Omnitrophica bacterium]|nr:F0F1 ATP synthase subunit alpha [Candidatus Omnitrophota bacterium]